MTAQLERRNTERADEARTFLVPRCDILETEGLVKLFADMPGVPDSGAEVTLDDGVLTVSGAIQNATNDAWMPAGGALSRGTWRRAFHLSRDADSASIKAHMKDGVLTVTVAKKKPARATIPVTSG